MFHLLLILIPNNLNLTFMIFMTKIRLMTNNNKFNNQVFEPPYNTQFVTVE